MKRRAFLKAAVAGLLTGPRPLALLRSIQGHAVDAHCLIVDDPVSLKVEPFSPEWFDREFTALREIVDQSSFVPTQTTFLSLSKAARAHLEWVHRIPREILYPEDDP